MDDAFVWPFGGRVTPPINHVSPHFFFRHFSPYASGWPFQSSSFFVKNKRKVHQPVQFTSCYPMFGWGCGRREQLSVSQGYSSKHRRLGIEFKILQKLNISNASRHSTSDSFLFNFYEIYMIGERCSGRLSCQTQQSLHAVPVNLITPEKLATHSMKRNRNPI